MSSNWFFRTLKWFIDEFKHIGIGLIGIVIVWGATYFISDYIVLTPFDSPEHIVGTVLQLLGLMIVALGFQNTRRVFGRPWIKPPPSFNPRTHHLEAANLFSSTTLSSGALTIIEAREPTLELRIELLEANLKIATTQVAEASRNLQDEINHRLLAINTERIDRIAGDEKIQNQLEKAVVGGISLEATGVIWLAAGVILSAL